MRYTTYAGLNPAFAAYLNEVTGWDGDFACLLADDDSDQQEES